MGDCNVKDAMSIFTTYNTLRVDYIKKDAAILNIFFYLKRLKSLEKFSFLIKYRKIFATQEKLCRVILALVYSWLMLYQNL